MGSIERFGGVMALITAGLMALGVAAQILRDVDPMIGLGMHALFFLAGLSGLGAVPAFRSLCRDLAPGVTLWLTAVAYLSFALLARVHFQDAMAGGLPPDVSPWGTPDGLLILGGLGSWMFGISLMARKVQTIPGVMLMIGLLAAALWILGIPAHSLNVALLQQVSLYGGILILTPLWLVGLGLQARHLTDAPSPAATPHTMIETQD